MIFSSELPKGGRLAFSRVTQRSMDVSGSLVRRGSEFESFIDCILIAGLRTVHSVAVKLIYIHNHQWWMILMMITNTLIGQIQPWRHVPSLVIRGIANWLQRSHLLHSISSSTK